MNKSRTCIRTNTLKVTLALKGTLQTFTYIVSGHWVLYMCSCGSGGRAEYLPMGTLVVQSLAPP